MRRMWLLIGLISSITLASACEATDPEIESERARLAALAQRIDLPEVPPLEALQIAAQYPDGSYSIAGVQRLRDELMDEEIEVIGIVREHYRCELETDSEDEEYSSRRAGCRLEHAYLSDSLRANARLLIVGLTPEQDSELEEGRRYRVRGMFTRRATGHLSPENGLLDVQELAPMPEGY